jgi:hypothetical protein
MIYEILQQILLDYLGPIECKAQVQNASRQGAQGLHQYLRSYRSLQPNPTTSLLAIVWHPTTGFRSATATACTYDDSYGSRPAYSSRRPELCGQSKSIGAANFVPNTDEMACIGLHKSRSLWLRHKAAYRQCYLLKSLRTTQNKEKTAMEKKIMIFPHFTKETVYHPVDFPYYPIPCTAIPKPQVKMLQFLITLLQSRPYAGIRTTGHQFLRYT